MYKIAVVDQNLIFEISDAFLAYEVIQILSRPVKIYIKIVDNIEFIFTGCSCMICFAFETYPYNYF